MPSSAANDLQASASFSARKKNSSTYFSEYASGFFEPCAAHLRASPLPRNEGLLRQTPSNLCQFHCPARCGL